MIKKFSLIGFLLLALFFGQFNLFVNQAKAATVNLIANPSVETNSNNLPTSWLKDSWGQNSPTFTYQTIGQNGSHSLSVKMSGYVSGDAKWYFQPVAVTYGHTYTFSDYYKATVATYLVAQTEDGSGNFNYFQIGASLPTSKNWKNISGSFTPGTGVTSLTIFHLINKNGTLQTDSFDLHEETVPVPDPTPNEAIPNSSLETVSSTNSQTPSFWNESTWGKNTPVFTYLTGDAHSGTRSVKTQLTSYSSGDAKWYYPTQAVDGNKSFTFSDYYKANVVTRVVAEVTNSDMTLSYFELKNATPATNWTKYSTNFTTPSSAVRMTIFHLISSVGSLTTDDYSLTTYVPTTFNRTLVTLTFDDGWKSQATTGLPMLKNYNFPATFYLVSGFINNTSSGYMTSAEVNSLIQNGHEIGIHTVNHPHLTTLSNIDVVSQLKNSQAYFQNNFGVLGDNFASPYGEVDSRVLGYIETYYRSHRGVIDGYNTASNFDIYDLKVKNVFLTTTSSEVQSWVSQAALDHSWLILVYHEIDHGGDPYGTTPENLASQLAIISASKLPVLTIEQGLNEVVPQIK